MQIDGQSGGRTGRQKDIKTNGQAEKQADTQTDNRTDRHACRQTDVKTAAMDRRTDKMGRQNEQTGGWMDK